MSRGLGITRPAYRFIGIVGTSFGAGAQFVIVSLSSAASSLLLPPLLIILMKVAAGFSLGIVRWFAVVPRAPVGAVLWLGFRPPLG